MAKSVSVAVEEGGWTEVHSLYFISFAIGLFIEGFVFTIVSYATTWYSIPKYLSVFLLGWPFIWLIAGVSLIGPIADRIGRKRTWIYTMTMYAIGGIILALSVNYELVLLSTAILVFAAAGEMSVILAMANEMFPRRHRSKAVLLLTDFNGGVAPLIAGILGFITASATVSFQRYLSVATVFAALAALIVIRYRTPESVRWLEKKGMVREASEEAKKYFNLKVDDNEQQDNGSSTKAWRRLPLWAIMAIIIPIAWANSAGYGLITYTLGPLYYPRYIDYIFLFTGIGAVLGGLLGVLGDRVSRKSFLLWTYVAVLLLTISVVATIGLWSKMIALFWGLLIALNFVEQPSYEAIEIMKAELWPTRVRGSLIAVARALPILLYLPVLYFASELPLSQYLVFNVAIWAIGTAAAIAWYFLGHETGKGVSIGLASGEE